eukprot:Lankesteria_metandrocarpae@DN9946_c0_g1_i1.p1
MVTDNYPLPLIWDKLQIAAGKQWYTTVDLSWGFWNVPVAEGSRPYTAIITHRGTFHFNVIPFGMKNRRGNAFSGIFRKLATTDLMVFHVFASPYYPQGNVINKAHHALERALSLRLWLGGDYLKNALLDNMAVHNSCPHVSLGKSPFYAVFRFEATLPG